MTFECILLTLLGILYVMIASKFYTEISRKRKNLLSRYSFFPAAILCIVACFIFLRAGLTDPVKFAMLFTGLYMLSNAFLNLDFILGLVIFSAGIYLLNPFLTVVTILFLLITGLSGLIIFKENASNY